MLRSPREEPTSTAPLTEAKAGRSSQPLFLLPTHPGKFPTASAAGRCNDALRRRFWTRVSGCQLGLHRSPSGSEGMEGGLGGGRQSPETPPARGLHARPAGLFWRGRGSRPMRFLQSQRTKEPARRAVNGRASRAPTPLCGSAPHRDGLDSLPDPRWSAGRAPSPETGSPKRRNRTENRSVERRFVA